MFEAIHGTAPDIAGKNLANPSGLLLAGVMMLGHLGQGDVATKVHNAWLRTIEDGVHTSDLYNAELTKHLVGTDAFAEAVIARLGQLPNTFRPVSYADGPAKKLTSAVIQRPPATRELVGVDVFLDYENRNPQELGESLRQISEGGSLSLNMITNRGVKVFPNGFPETFCTDHWRCRFMSATEGERVKHSQILALLARVIDAKFEVIKTEYLFRFDGEPGYSLGQGQ
jgi:isocitrate dehydrogenase